MEEIQGEDLLGLLNSDFLRGKEVDMWRTAAGDPYPMEKNPDEIPMSHPILQGKPNASHMCARIIYTHMIRQNESNTIAVIKRTRV
jgi:hypothetical protein